MSNRRKCYPSQKAKENMETEAITLFWKVFTQTQNSKSTNDTESLKILLTKINAAYDLANSNTERIGNDIKLAYANLIGEIQKKIASLQTTESKPEACVHHSDKGDIIRVQQSPLKLKGTFNRMNSLITIELQCTHLDILTAAKISSLQANYMEVCVILCHVSGA